ncbi:DUF742 domain-containing protein [Natronosporangium hydrolyticum]|uniref:DUF742 domain-containing protein n=1 Tax=Natronosporangium hydrolyticum TaxID=2811111 RepID=A0A895YNT6_9ACTN|nr:DUF742 domain-containing protein [Natronosporangium hydrolyticum]QSB15790.1 DUF742 domain-containing protein [Natronosporangium hydrolyticum]
MPFPPPEAGQDYDEAGPVVRPYTVTSGRTRPSRGRLDLVSMVVAVGSAAASVDRTPEQRAIVALAQRPISLAELAAQLNLPASLVQVLLGDLLDAELISISQPYPAGYYHRDTLEAIRDGLRAL